MALIDVIEFDGKPDEFVWKYPNDELGTWTQLVVHQTQEAVLFKDGRALDLFGPGRHTLSTANIPMLNKLINLPFGGKSPFKAEVWFIKMRRPGDGSAVLVRDMRILRQPGSLQKVRMIGSRQKRGSAKRHPASLNGFRFAASPSSNRAGSRFARAFRTAPAAPSIRGYPPIP
jgi:hypothetical protein